jgi:hypothetical protein
MAIQSCTITTDAITIVFTDAVDSTSKSNYTIFDPDSKNFTSPVPPDNTPSLSLDKKTVTIPLSTTAGGLNDDGVGPGDDVLIVITGIRLASDPTKSALDIDPTAIARRVPGGGPTGQIVRDVEDAIAYPILTEQVSAQPAAPMPVTGMPGPSAGSIGQIASKAVTDVLGWKVNASDPKGFVGALTQAFTLTEVEGHTEATWVPRTYAVQTDLGGGITGAQASLYTRAKQALDSSLPLLDGLYALDPEADPEYVKALREMARSQMAEIVKELGAAGGPSVLRVDTYFKILLNQDTQTPNAPVQADPDKIGGTLGSIRDTYGIFFENNPFSNSIEDEQDITNFRVISDYMTSLAQSWISNRKFFLLVTPGAQQQAFFGTQLVLISRQLSVIADTVNEVRFVLDSVFIGASERQTLLLVFPDNANTPPMFLEDILNEVVDFVSDEGPRLLRDGGRIAVTNNILPVVDTLQNLVELAHDPANIDQLPDGFKTVRVRNALDDLADQLQTLFNLSQQVGQDVPAPEPPVSGALSVTGVIPSPDTNANKQVPALIAGTGFKTGIKAVLNPQSQTPPSTASIKDTKLLSANLLTATIELGNNPHGTYDLTVSLDGSSALLKGALIL